MKNSNKKGLKMRRNLTGKQKTALSITSVILIILIILGAKYGPSYVEMYKQIQSAKISILNDDLEGAVVSYEKAYEEVQQSYLLEEIENLNALIESKRAFIKAENFEADKKYDSAYAYYKKVATDDKERYEKAQIKLEEIAEIIVEDIYKQADHLYDSHLYAMVIGRLQTALDYNVKVEETEAKIAEYKQVFYNYYCDQAKNHSEQFFNNEAFYNLFTRDLENASLYIQTTQEKTELENLSTKLLEENILNYLNLAEEAIKNQDQEAAQYYINIVLEFDEENTEAKQLLESVK
ncbi:MAG TPA: hypothetical protein DCY20_06865 [Firmicutes bacterium]|nr:hypothetical protein [Bacillota bacterium]